MFPAAGVRYDPVQWWAPKDCRPSGKPQVCGRQSAHNCASWQLWIKTLSGHLNHWGTPPPAPNLYPPALFSSAGQGAWRSAAAVGRSHAACRRLLPSRAFSKALSRWSQAAHLSPGHTAAAGAFHGPCLSSSGQRLRWAWERCWLCPVALRGEVWAPWWPLPVSALNDPKEKLWNGAVYI